MLSAFAILATALAVPVDVSVTNKSPGDCWVTCDGTTMHQVAAGKAVVIQLDDSAEQWTIVVAAEGGARVVMSGVSLKPGKDLALTWLGGPKHEDANADAPSAKQCIADRFTAQAKHPPGRPLSKDLADRRCSNGELAWTASGRTFYTDRFGIMFAETAPGKYASKNGGRTVEIEITQPFLTALSELTVSQAGLIEGGADAEPSDRPKAFLNWTAADALATKAAARTGLAYQLPTESQWELAARGGEDGPYSPGGKPLTKIAWFAENARGTQHDVATRLPNALGYFDFHGSMREWCRDRFAAVRPGGKDPTGPETGEERVRRGGGYNTPAAWGASNFRDSAEPDYGDQGSGVRFIIPVDSLRKRLAETTPGTR